MNSKLLAVAAGCGLYVASMGIAQAVIISVIPFNFEVTDMTLTGSGAIALGDGGGGTYQDVFSDIEVTERANGAGGVGFSSVSGSITTSTTAAGGVMVDTLLTGVLWGVFEFTDADATFDYANGASVIAVTPDSAYTIEALLSITLDPGVDPVVATSVLQSDLKTITSLTFDVNGNSVIDEIGIEFGDLLTDLLEIDIGTGTIPELEITIEGEVADSVTDPPFGPFDLTGPITLDPIIPAPEPGSLALAGIGLAFLGLRRRRS